MRGLRASQNVSPQTNVAEPLEWVTAAALLNEARASGWWTLDAGLDPMWERWESGEAFDAGFPRRELQPIDASVSAVVDLVLA
jgi:hypothetical protein